ncbi:uncharacterized protein [Dysidea avara]|uniref:uncharacterized protein n=1 Tax=Dysidea avara TaxID=196820 RepID=UPI00332EBAAA
MAAGSTLGKFLLDSNWQMEVPRIFQVLKPSQSVLVAGCGGGYDITSGLPLYFNLTKQGKQVHLANLSFSDIDGLTSTFYCSNCVKVDSHLKIKRQNPSYFPEYYLSRWFKEKWNEEVPIYAFAREIGVKELTKAYNKIVAEHKIDAIVLVDGGTDSVTFGNEQLMGTPAEDHCSMAAVHGASNVPVKLLACLGFGVDSFHGVSHGLFLENTAKLEQTGGYLGCFSISKSSPECKLYMEAYNAIAANMQASIVCTSIISALQGHFGDHHTTRRTGSSELFINPLMGIYWTYQLDKVMEQIPYTPKLADTKSMNDVGKTIADHHSKQEHRKRIQLPM